MYVRSMAIASELDVVLPLVEDGANAWTVAANAAIMNPTFMRRWMVVTMMRMTLLRGDQVRHFYIRRNSYIPLSLIDLSKLNNNDHLGRRRSAH